MPDPDRPLVPCPLALLEDLLSYLDEIQAGFAGYKEPSPDALQVEGFRARIRDVMTQAKKAQRKAKP